MTDALAIRTKNTITIDDAFRLGDVFAASRMFKDSSDAAVAITRILAGSELGMTPFQAMTNIFIISGRVTLSANAMASAVKSSRKYDYVVQELSDTRCAIEFFQGKKSLGVSEFTLEDAKRAGTQNITKFPRNMLFARAMSNGVKWYCPDVFDGQTIYTPDELGAEVDYETGEVVESLDPKHQKFRDAIEKLNTAAKALGVNLVLYDDTTLEKAENAYKAMVVELIAVAKGMEQEGESIVAYPNTKKAEDWLAYIKQVQDLYVPDDGMPVSLIEGEVVE